MASEAVFREDAAAGEHQVALDEVDRRRPGQGPLQLAEDSHLEKSANADGVSA